MKKIFIYLVSAMMLASCSSDSLLEEEKANVPDINVDLSLYENCNYTIMPTLKGEGADALTRSLLYYNGSKTTFSWQVNADKTKSDHIDVYSISAKNTPMRYVIDEVAEGSDGKLGIFGKTDNGYQSFSEQQYVAFYPSKSSEQITYEKIPVSYINQKQIDNPWIFYNKYRNDKTATDKTPEECDNVYQESERKGCAHLPLMDYLVAGPTKPSIAQSLHFQMKRVSAIIRFFIVIPEERVYDMLQVYNPNVEKPFVVETTMSALTKDLAETPTTTSNSIYLKLGDAGFDFTSENTDSRYYKYSDTYPRLLVAYMMAAPIDLSASTDKQCVLYLHSDSNTPQHKIWKATLDRKNLKQDFLNQWTVRSTSEAELIQFVETTVQEWKEATGISNEKGTEKW